ncbi:MAG: sulfatase, partial [Candidatus Omnitrophica bacterium]|nr:sulfatase [Candidatus Omnitrophota bacterium]
MATKNHDITRRTFLGTVGAAAVGSALASTGKEVSSQEKPNVVYVFADQWRAQSFGHCGDPDAITPNIDALSKESVNFTHAVSGMPVCSPYRASLLTGQYWLTHGVFVNDVHLSDDTPSLADAFKAGGYDTAYIGKWHVDGRGRSSFIPRERRKGFDYWKVLECTHNYNHSDYFADSPEKLIWPGYDAIAQTRDAQEYIRNHSKDKPFLLVLSWGPPHNPYETAPEEYKKMHPKEKVHLRPNVPEDHAAKAREDIAGYNAHCTTLDACLGDILDTLKETGLDENTLFVFTSDHGDMLFSQGMQRKQKPWNESLMVPLMMRWPKKFGHEGREVDTLINTPDIMPTLLGLCGLSIPDTVEGKDYSAPLLKGETPEADAALIMCPWPFGEWIRKRGGK